MRLNKLLDFNRDVLRNIVSLRKSTDLFDDLHDKNELSSAIAVAAESRVKQHILVGQIDRAFYYSTAINYPFETEPYQTTRYSNGSYPSWYGSLNLTTSVYETAYHMLKAELAIEGVNEKIIRERAVYDVHCQAALIDLTNQQKFYAQLTHPTDYTLTQQVGQRIYREGHPGLIAPSARHDKGANVVVFNKQILQNPRLKCYLTYLLDPFKKEITVKRSLDRIWFKILY